LGAAKNMYNLFKVVALVVALVSFTTGALVVYDASQVNVVPPSSSDVVYSYVPGSWFNVTFPVTIQYGGSAFTLKNTNLTLIIYPTADGTGTPLFPANSTFFDIPPHQNKVIDYSFSLASPPALIHVSLKVIVKGQMVLGSVTFIEYGVSRVFQIV